jgi:hypothetical protein
MQSQAPGQIPSLYNPPGKDLPPSGYQQDQNLHVKDFLLQIAKTMEKQPEEIKIYFKILEDKWICTINDLSLLTETELLHNLNFPLGLVKNIIKKIASGP